MKRYEPEECTIEFRDPPAFYISTLGFPEKILKRKDFSGNIRIKLYIRKTLFAKSGFLGRAGKSKRSGK